MVNTIISAVMAMLMSFFGSLYTPVTPLAQVPQSAAAVEQTLKIMNYNLYVFGTGDKTPENRCEGIVTVIKEYMPDSFGTEEADEGWRARLSAALDEYACTGDGRDGGEKGEASPVFYLKDKYELVSSETVWLSKTPGLPSKSWDAWINRIATIAVLRDKNTGFTYAHINAHFDNIGAVSRNEAVAIISAKAEQLDCPVVFTGDLNGKEGTLMYNRIVSAGFSDTKYLARKTDAGATYHGYALLDKMNYKPIDYIFVNGCVKEVAEYKIIREQINGMYPSDHYPVFAELTMFYNTDV